MKSIFILIFLVTLPVWVNQGGISNEPQATNVVLYTNIPNSIVLDTEINLSNFANSGNGTVENPYVISLNNFTSDSIQLYLTGLSSFVIIENNTFTGTGDTSDIAISIYQSSNVLVRFNQIFDNNKGVKVKSSLNVNITQNYIEGNYEGIRTEGIGRNYIYDNEITGGHRGIFLGESTQVENNYIHHVGNIGIITFNGDGSVISGNTIVNNTFDGIAVNDGNIRIRDNFIGSNQHHGIATSINGFPVSPTYIENNTIVNNSESGISISNTVKLNVRDNYISNNSKSGIVISYTTSVKSISNSVTQNIISSNKEYGINVLSGSLGVIRFNDIKDNVKEGLFFGLNAKDNIVDMNNITGNNFINSSQQITSASFRNTINQNYWGSLSDVDLNLDGFYDNGYSVSNYTVDIRALVNPYTTQHLVSIPVFTTDNLDMKGVYQVKWNYSFDTKGYQLNYSLSISSDAQVWTHLGNTTSNSMYLATGTYTDGLYFFSLTAFNNISISNSIITVINIKNRELLPVSLQSPTLGTILDREVILTWSAAIDTGNSSEIITYKLEWAYNTFTTLTWFTVIEETVLTSFTWDTNALTSGREILFRITAFNTIGDYSSYTSGVFDLVHSVINTDQPITPTEEYPTDQTTTTASTTSTTSSKSPTTTSENVNDTSSKSGSQTSISNESLFPPIFLSVLPVLYLIIKSKKAKRT